MKYSFRRKNFLKSPALIVFFQWVMLIFAYQMTMAELQPLNLFFILIVFIFILFLALGEGVAGSMPIIKQMPKKMLEVKVIYLFALLTASYTLYLFLVLVAAGGFETALDFRDTLFYTSDNQKSSLEVGVSFPFVAAAVFIARLETDLKNNIFFSILLLILAILSTSKIYLFLFAFFMLPNFSEIKPKHIGIAAFGLLVLFSLSHIVLEKFSSDPEDGLIDAILKTFEVYLLSGVGAFQMVLDGNAYLPEMRSLYGINQILPFKITGVPDTNILPFVAIDSGWMTNVYTALGVWWNDFGIFGLAVISFFIGFMYKIIWRSNTYHAKFMAKFSLLPLLFTAFDDFFLMSLKTWVIFYIVAVFISITKINNSIRTN